MSDTRSYPMQRLGELVSGSRGVSYKPENLKTAFDDNSVFLLRSNNIQSGTLNFENVQIVPDSLVSDSQMLKKGDIAICMSNGSRQLVGKSGMLQHEAEYPLTVGAFCSVFRCHNEDDSEYVRYLFQSQAYQHGIDVALAGSAINNLKNSGIEAIEVPTAPKELRKKIAEVLSTIDNQIDATQALIDKYTAIKQGMMADLFSRGIDPQTKALRPTFKDAPELYHKTPLGMLPKGWVLVRTETVAREVVVGIVIEPSKYYTSEGVPVFRSANIQENKINPRNFVHMSEESNQLNRKSMLRTGDVITVRTGYPGTTCVITEEYDRSNAVDIIITRLGENVIPEFFSLWVNSDSGKGQVLSAQGGLAQQHFNVGEMKNLLVPRISLSEQELILSTAGSLLKKIELETHHLLKLKLQKQGLMQDLLTGKVPVPA